MLDTYELIHAEAVEAGKPAPDVIIDFGKEAKVCGLGEKVFHNTLLTDEFGPMVRLIIKVDYNTKNIASTDKLSYLQSETAIFIVWFVARRRRATKAL